MKNMISKNISFASALTLAFAFLSAFAFIPALSYAQENTSGTVVYEQVKKLEIKLDGAAAEFAHMMPKERKSNKVLHFNQSASLYENKAKEEDETMAMSSGHGNVMIKMQEPENKVFTDLESKKQVEQKEFMTRTFLIEGAVDHKWKITGEQKMILDFPCQEAVVEVDSVVYSAWFTPVIPVSAGPANYGGLPGLVLGVESEDGKNTTLATSVEFVEIEKEMLSKPKKGKKVSREEFETIVEEKMKEMGAEHGNGGNQMIIRIHR